MPMIAGVPAATIDRMRKRAATAYADLRPKSQAQHQTSRDTYLDGVPMHWMTDWPQPFPMVVSHAKGAQITDIDGNRLDDFCLGDTGSMFGHAPPALARAIRAQAGLGLTFMLPTADTELVGAQLSATFGDMRWQIATTATDANRFALRVARAVTGRRRVLVFNGCYHGTVDDAMVALEDGQTVNRPGLLGQVRDLSETAVACEFNDLDQVEQALALGDVAAILTEPVMTNSCMVLPDAGFHDGLRRLARKHGAILIIDETHTISSGHGGYTRTHGLHPDIFVAGKCVAGGMPTAVWGMTPALAKRYAVANAGRAAGHSGMGTTLSGNPMQFACLRATLDQIMTPANYSKMDKGAARLASGLACEIHSHRAPWHVVRVGARVEFICHPTPLRNGTEAAQAHHPTLEAAIHAALLNRGCLIAPFHNMMLVSPATTTAQIDRLIKAFGAVLDDLFGPKP